MITVLTIFAVMILVGVVVGGSVTTLG